MLLGVHDVSVNNVSTQFIKVLYDSVDIGSWQCRDSQTNRVTITCRRRHHCCINHSRRLNDVQLRRREQQFCTDTWQMLTVTSSHNQSEQLYKHNNGEFLFLTLKWNTVSIFVYHLISHNGQQKYTNECQPKLNTQLHWILYRHKFAVTTSYFL